MFNRGKVQPRSFNFNRDLSVDSALFGDVSLIKGNSSSLRRMELTVISLVMNDVTFVTAHGDCFVVVGRRVLFKVIDKRPSYSRGHNVLSNREVMMFYFQI